MLKRKLSLEDDFDWSLPPAGSCPDGDDVRSKLKYIAGVDISFLKEDPSIDWDSVRSKLMALTNQKSEDSSKQKKTARRN
jgi:hypothetical protein